MNFDKFHIVGGQTRHKNELCLLSNTVSCAQEFSIDMPGLEEPILFGVNTSGSCNLTIPNHEPKETKELMIFSNAKFNEIDKFVPVKKTNYRNDKYTFSDRNIDKLILKLIRVYSYCKTVLSMDGRLLLTLNESFLYLILTIDLTYLSQLNLTVKVVR